jgi:hypothetical protein
MILGNDFQLGVLEGRMMYNISMHSSQELIRDYISGKVDLGGSIKNLKALLEAWRNNETLNILIDIRESQIQFTPRDVCSLVDMVMKTKLGRLNRVAMVYRPPAKFDPVRFFEYLIIKAGLRLKVCENVEEAAEWLSVHAHP